jgi:WD40 repeat protein
VWDAREDPIKAATVGPRSVVAETGTTHCLAAYELPDEGRVCLVSGHHGGGWVWDGDSLEKLHKIETRALPVVGLHVFYDPSTGSPRIATIIADAKLRIIDGRSFSVLHTVELPGWQLLFGQPLQAYSSAEGMRLVVPVTRNIVVFAAEEGTVVRVLELPDGAVHEPITFCTTFLSSAGTPLLVAGGEGAAPARIWDLESGHCIAELYKASRTAVHFADSDQRTCIASPWHSDITVRVHPSRGLHTACLVSLCCLPQVYDTLTGEWVRTLTEHSDTVSVLAGFETATGQPRLVSGGYDRCMIVWDPSAGEALHIFKAWAGDIVALHLLETKAGRYQAVLTDGSEIRVWDLGPAPLTGALVRSALKTG